MTTPAWQAPINGFPGNLNAVDSADHINQFLSAHPAQEIYDGSDVVRAGGGTQLTLVNMPDSLDFDQPITMSGTSIGRVQLPLMPVGNGADILVQLWPDNGSGNPNQSGSPLASVKVPAAYINNVAASTGLENATTPLMNEQNNELGFTGNVQTFPWLTPAADVNGSINNSSLCNTSDTMIFLGGLNATATAVVNTVASTTAQGAVLAQPIPQPPLPIAIQQGGAVVVEESTVLYIGGSTASAAAVANGWAAAWNQGTHSMGTWSAQTALPNPIQHSAVASWGNTVYVLGGADASNNPQASVYSASITNNQVGAWQTLRPLPISVVDAFAAAVQGWLFVIGGRANLLVSSGVASGS